MHAELRCTYRLQLRDLFGFHQAADLVPYLRKLGISHVYLSPILKACAHSEHGYDGVDPTQVEPRFGGEEGLKRLFDQLRSHRMAAVLDIVPNHLAATSENPWWQDVLENGPSSEHAAKFDIDWQADGGDGRILLPILGDHLAQVLSRGELELEERGDRAVFRYYDQIFPLSPESLSLLRGGARNPADLLDAQYYRLACWRTGSEELNYRRFFDVTSLVGVRVEDPDVFDATHRKLFEIVADGPVDGLRIDHPDGLRDPAAYFSRLRQAVPHLWIIAEKILEPGETLPSSWPIDGTTGYDFLNRAGGLFVDGEREAAFTAAHAEFTGESAGYEKLVAEQKRRLAVSSFAVELRRLARSFRRIALCGHRLDCTIGQAEAMLATCLSAFPVYRNYVTASGTVSAADAKHTARALEAVRNSDGEKENRLTGLLELLLNGGGGNDPREADFLARFQQLTGPVMAKGVEDTVFYQYDRLIALNEVGGDPSVFGIETETFHDEAMRSQRLWPRSMLASSTHDTKRSEDVRARLYSLPETGDLWSRRITGWSAAHRSAWGKVEPDRHTEQVFYQTWVGAWPIETERIEAYLIKAAREAKRRTSWTDPDTSYEEALLGYARAAMSDPATRDEVERLASGMMPSGHSNSLSQTLLKLTSPGIPDIYQGCELWNRHLVDPDNRMPVDYDLRRRLLDESSGLTLEEILKRQADGLPKLKVIREALALRKRLPGCFGPGDSGAYVPLRATGERKRHLVAFRRGGRVAVAVPRLVGALAGDWRDTAIPLGEGEWRNVFDGHLHRGVAAAQELFREFPVALLERLDFTDEL